MRFSDILSEVFTNFKIEKWNKKTCSWDSYRSFIDHNSAVQFYRLILKNERGIFRLIKIMEIDEL